MQPATKHYLFFAFLLVSLALLVALVLWQGYQVDEEATEENADRPAPAPASDGQRPPSNPAASNSLRPPLAPAPSIA